MTQISIMWEGPISIKKAKNLDKDSDIGLYQLYGRHPIFGRDSLLYIGRTFDSFPQRAKAHVGSHPDMGEVLHDETRWKGAVGYSCEMYRGRLFPSVTCGELKKLIVGKKEKLKKLCGKKKLGKRKCTKFSKKLDKKLDKLNQDKGVDKLLVEDAEALLIHACTPPWNSNYIQTCDLILEDLRILNFGSCGSLLTEVSAEFWI